MKKKNKNILVLRNWMDQVDLASMKFRAKCRALFNGKVKLERGDSRNIAGVCQTLGEYFEVNPVYLRIGFVAGTFLSLFTGIFLYILLIFLIPSRGPSFMEFGDAAFRKKPQPDEDPNVVDMQLCESCNTAVLANAKFCHRCGAFVGEIRSETY